ncbi:MAG: hypothetical protein HZA61_02775 [Candidatus Eisenbacteria bacterium]|uniref:Cellobiose phosphorylase n=1 Tax=Eiseniibacteriota bacterium TaxID=2212470 RepID=A0A933W9I0_UNCEI|nr:hypothetical protein [Candidatus Eisenbacteria bacterium]
MSLLDGTRGLDARNGGLVPFAGQEFLRITDFDRLPPFLMSIPSDTDLWMFVSSAGGLTAGRADADGALFPYVTVDQLHDAHHHTGPVTLFRVRRDDGAIVAWEPFAHLAGRDPAIERNLYKHPLGNQVIFEEIHHGLKLAFRYRWAACDAYGHVRSAQLENLADEPASVTALDGVRNVLPFGAPLGLYQHSSSLVDAYKRSEVDEWTGLGIFSLTSVISDRAEAAEMLRANTVWGFGLAGARVALSAAAVDAFRRGEDVPSAPRVNGERGNYLVQGAFELEPGATHGWHLALDAGRGHAEVAALRSRLLRSHELGAELESQIAEAGENLRRNVASADGLQRTGDAQTSAHHLANVLFNNMRGGVFAKHHLLPAADLADFVRTRNRTAAERHAAWLDALPAELTFDDLLERAARTGDPALERLTHEYLPIHFGRRHGDPSRPWNRFTIRVREADGSRALRYEGNWRDIFQNWEALAASFPAFLPGILAKFVNASTPDGFNPYRVTRDGIDWEVEEPGHPWSNIGYWGDHQVIYLLKFLEAMRETRPGALEAMLARPIFAYAEVPYRLAPFAKMVENPRATITFDHDLAARIAAREQAEGTDGRLVHDAEGAVLHVTLFEKLLVSTLSKLSNYVPDAGIWMNTQRPEWNDANNALVGNGVSVVTLAYLRRSLAFLLGLFESCRDAEIPVSAEVAGWARELRVAFESHAVEPYPGEQGDRERFEMVAVLGDAFTRYRAQVEEHGFSAPEPLAVTEALALLRTALAHVEGALRANEREDGLYHSYNLLEFDRSAGTLRVSRLSEMLEGQVAALSSGLVEPTRAVRLLDRMFASRLYRDDQRSFMLYPEKTLPGFLEKNVAPPERVDQIPLLRALVAERDTSVIVRDASWTYRFAPDIRHVCDLSMALDRLAAQHRWSGDVARDRQEVLALFEEVFQHHSFTGRSGTMYGYEGIGSIYWHMVAKLLLAVQETSLRAERERSPESVRRALAGYYYRVRAGLGFEKSAEEYGAFPTDPYSHTPAKRGAQQPGMTGQVKEEILTRMGELGVRVEAGRLVFRPHLLRAEEFLSEASVAQLYGHDGAPIEVELPAGSLLFTVCQVPVRYERTTGPASVRVIGSDGRESTIEGDTLDAGTSRAVLERTGEVARVEVKVPEGVLRTE